MIKKEKKNYWVILVGDSYGAFILKETEAEAEEMRCHKANWEKTIAKKRLATKEEVKSGKPSNCWNDPGFVNWGKYKCDNNCKECNGEGMAKKALKIPKGDYCYTRKGSKHILCPYWSIRKNKPEQVNGYCSYLFKGDWDINRSTKLKNPKTGRFIKKNINVSLLWDQVKECRVNLWTEKELEQEYKKGKLIRVKVEGEKLYAATAKKELINGS